MKRSPLYTNRPILSSGVERIGIRAPIGARGIKLLPNEYITLRRIQRGTYTVRPSRTDEEAFISPLRTDSRQLVSKIYWWQSAKNGIMRELEWREPTGFVWFAPAGGGNLWVDVNGGSSKITRTAEAAM